MTQLATTGSAIFDYVYIGKLPYDYADSRTFNFDSMSEGGSWGTRQGPDKAIYSDGTLAAQMAITYKEDGTTIKENRFELNYIDGTVLVNSSQLDAVQIKVKFTGAKSSDASAVQLLAWDESGNNYKGTDNVPIACEENEYIVVNLKKDFGD